MNEKLIQKLETIAEKRYELEQKDDELYNQLLEGIAELFKDYTCPHCGKKFQDDALYMGYMEHQNWQLRCGWPCEFHSPRMKSLAELLEFMETAREFFGKKRESDEVV